MIVLGLTGSVGMGKSTAAAMFRHMRIPVDDADAVVHQALAKGGAAVGQVAAVFPGVESNGVIDRQALGARVFGDPAALRRLEAILHPLVGKARQRFLKRMRARRVPLVVLDVPLLFEVGGDASCDAVVVMTAPGFLQRARVMARPGMNAARFKAMLQKQMPDAEKRRRADFVVPSGLGRAVTWRRLRQVLSRIACRGGEGQTDGNA